MTDDSNRPYFAPPLSSVRMPETEPLSREELTRLQRQAEDTPLENNGVFGGGGDYAKLEKRVKELESLVAKLLARVR